MVQLDESQKAFVEAPIDQNIRLLAPAGCGKTLCLLHRCKHVMQQAGSDTPKFLILTFTGTAGKELERRIAENSVFTALRDPMQTEIRTLNSWGLRRVSRKKFSTKTITPGIYHFIMKNDLQPIWMEHETIRDAVKRKSNTAPKKLMKMLDMYLSLCFEHERVVSLEDFESYWNLLGEKGLDWQFNEQVDELIRLEILDEDTVDSNRSEQYGAVYEVWYEFWRQAIVQLYRTSKFTYPAQKYWAYLDERSKLDEGSFRTGVTQYQHIVVDEFQDVNPLDIALIRAIFERSRATLTIAGDDDQAIFEWRGSSPHYILDPEDVFDASFDTYSLGVNYRSPQNIVEHSQRLIAFNRRRLPKRVVSSSSRRATIEVRPIQSLNDSLDYVHKLVNAAVASNSKSRKIALISRLQSQVIPYQIFFALHEIPFCAPKDILILLSETFDRLLRLLEIKSCDYSRAGAGQVVKDILFMCDYVKRHKLSTRKDRPALNRWLLKSRPRTIVDGIERLAEYRGELKSSKNAAGQMSYSMADALGQFIDAESVSDALLALSDNFSGLQKDYDKAEEDVFFKAPPLAQLAEYAVRYESDYDTFVSDLRFATENLALIPPIDDELSEEDLSGYPLHLMTAFRAKGEEYDRIVLLDAHENIWPGKFADSQEKLEAERRVFYVAFTRAREHVTILVRDGADPSPFIDQLGLPD